MLATHKVFAIKNIFLNDEIITEQQIGPSGDVISGKFNGKVRIKKYLGTDSQSADPDLLAAGITDINSNFRLRGCAYIYVRLDYDQNIFPSGIPNISADIWGKECFDPRTSTVKFTTNPVLYLYDFLTNSKFYGKALSASDIDTASFINEANICDAIVNTKILTLTVSNVDIINNSFAFADATIGLQTGDRVQISSTGSMPAGLVAGTNYYAIVDCTRKSPSVRLSSSLNNALAGTAIDITSAGSGTITIIKNGEPRYSANGVFDTATTDAEIISKLCSSFKGNIFAPGGYWYVRAGSWVAPTVSFNEDNFVEGITLNTKISRSDRFNGVRGTYISPLHDDQATDYPFIKSAGYEAEDLNSRILADFDLPFTTRSQTAQRLAKIHLLENRRQISLSVTVDLSGLKVQAGDIVNISYARYGWVNKTFRVECWVLTTLGDPVPALVVKLELREIDANVYVFDELTEEVIPNKPPSTTLSSAFAVEPPTGLTLFAGETELDVSGDGTVISRIKTVFTAPSNSFINNYEIFWKEASSSNWLIETIPNSASPIATFLVPVIDGKNYQVKIRSVNQLGVKSDFTAIINITVIGKSAPPDNVTSFTVQQNGGVVIFKWVAVTNTDLAGYTIKYGSTSASWAELKTLTEVTRGTNVTSADVPPGVHKFAIKARDTSGNESVSEITQIIEVTNSNDIIDVAEEWGHWNSAMWPRNCLRLRQNGGSAEGIILTGWNPSFLKNPDFGIDRFSVFVAFKKEGNPDGNGKIIFGNISASSRYGFGFYYDSASRLVAVTRSQTQQYAITISDVSWANDGKIAFVHISFDGTQLIMKELLSNTILGTDNTISAVTPTLTYDLVIGKGEATSSTGVAFKGQIACIAVWSKNKTDDEVLSLDDDNLEFLTSFSKDNGSIFLDESGKNVPMNFTGGLTLVNALNDPQYFFNNSASKNFIKNPLTGDLICEDSILAGANDNHAVFDNYIQSPFTQYTYVTPEKDLGFKNNVRIWNSYNLVLFPNQNQPKSSIELDHKDLGGIYDGYENWSIGFINDRFFKTKFNLDGSFGLGYLTSFKTVYDLEERSESGMVGIVADGTIITFAKQFHRLPVEVKITPQGSSALLATYENLTVNSVKINLFNSSGAAVAGTASYSVTGV